MAGGVDQAIDAQVDVTYHYFTSLNVAAVFKVGAVLSLSIVDITFGMPGIPVAAADLVSQERSMDQGFTDVAQGTKNNNLLGANGHFQAKLRRNHAYRLQFTLETVGEVSLLGVARMVGQASWSRLAVTIDEDEVELLSVHDAAIKGVIATHDTAIQARIATHDADIKQLLAAHDHDIKQLLGEVIRLLNTPAGRRPEFPNK